MELQGAAFRRTGADPVELVVTTSVKPVVCGVSVVTWTLLGCATRSGDCLFVDARLAPAQWIPVGDAVAHVPPLDTGRSLLTGIALPDGRWLLRSAEQDTAAVTMPYPYPPCMAAFYGWLLCGHKLANWPFQVMTCSSGRVRPGEFA